MNETRIGGRHGKGFIVSVSRSMRVAVSHRLTEADNADKRERERERELQCVGREKEKERERDRIPDLV